MKPKILTFLLCSAFLSSCCKPCCQYECYGADEFVIDSYKIREGKFAILDLEGHCVDELPEGALDEYADSLQEDDIINLAIYHPTRKDLVKAIREVSQTVGFHVKNGKLNIPDLAEIQVAGLSLEEARHHIEEEFRKEISEVDVFISYKDRLSRKVDLTGMAAVPYIPVDGKIRLYEVMSKARVPASANLFMSYVLRDGEPLAVDLHRLMVQGDMSQNIVMHGGDKIYVASPCESKVYVMGEVMMPRVVFLPTGSMPLAEALVSVGGIPFTGDRRSIQVIRGSLLQPKMYLLSWDHIVHLPNDSLLLMPGDTVYVSEKPITQWNRFISQLLPSVSGMTQARNAYKTLGL